MKNIIYLLILILCLSSCKVDDEIKDTSIKDIQPHGWLWGTWRNPDFPLKTFIISKDNIISIDQNDVMKDYKLFLEMEEYANFTQHVNRDGHYHISIGTIYGLERLEFRRSGVETLRFYNNYEEDVSILFIRD